MKIFDRLGSNTKFYTVSNQSVPTLVSSSWNKLIIFLQIASPLSQTRVSRSKVLTLQKDRGWPTFPLLLFFLLFLWTNYWWRWLAVSQPAGNFRHQSMLHSRITLLWLRLWNAKTVNRCVSLYLDWEHWIWLNVGTYIQCIGRDIQTVGCVPFEWDWSDRTSKRKRQNCIKSADSNITKLWPFFVFTGGRDSSVGIATSYGLDGPGIESPDTLNIRCRFRWPLACWHCGFESSRGHGSFCCVLYSKEKNAKSRDKKGRINGKEKIPIEARFSAPVQTWPGAHPASYKIGTGFLSRE